MSKLKSIIEKCKKQKTISTHLIVQDLIDFEQDYKQLQQKHKELQHYSNKHQQLMKMELKRLKAMNQKLREQQLTN